MVIGAMPIKVKNYARFSSPKKFSSHLSHDAQDLTFNQSTKFSVEWSLVN